MKKTYERGNEERTARADKIEEGKGEKRKREEENEENQTVTVKRRSEGFVSVEAFEFFSQGGDLEICGDLSWRDLCEKHVDLSDGKLDSCAHVRVVPDVTDVSSPSSVVTELCEVFSCSSDWEDVLPPSFSFSKKRAHCCTSTQEEMRNEGSQGKRP